MKNHVDRRPFTLSTEASIPLGNSASTGFSPRDRSTGRGRWGRIYDRFFAVLVAAGRVGLVGVPGPGSGPAARITEQDREWIAMYLRYDLHP